MPDSPVSYAVPDNPPDPESAALELIARLPEITMRDAGVRRSSRLTFVRSLYLREVLQELIAMLEMEGTFTGMSWHDAKHAAVAIVVDALGRDDAPEFLLGRARRARDGSDGITWDDPAAMERALTIGAKVVGL